VFATQPGQCIKAPVWEVMDKDSESDDFLTRAVPELKKMAKSSSSPPADAVNAALSKS